jgi:hypothetical protein
MRIAITFIATAFHTAIAAIAVTTHDNTNLYAVRTRSPTQSHTIISAVAIPADIPSDGTFFATFFSAAAILYAFPLRTETTPASTPKPARSLEPPLRLPIRHRRQLIRLRRLPLLSLRLRHHLHHHHLLHLEPPISNTGICAKRLQNTLP